MQIALMSNIEMETVMPIWYQSMRRTGQAMPWETGKTGKPPSQTKARKLPRYLPEHRFSIKKIGRLICNE